MTTYGSIAALIAAIRDEAETEVRQVEESARVATSRVRGAGDDGAASAQEADRQARLGAARQEAREWLAREEWLASKERLEAREHWIDAVRTEAHRRIRHDVPPARRRHDLTDLAAEALQHLPGDRFVVRVSPTDAAIIGADWTSSVCGSRSARVDIESDPGLQPGDCIVGTVDGSVSFDNTLDARSRRLESDWRASLGAVFDTVEPLDAASHDE